MTTSSVTTTTIIFFIIIMVHCNDDTTNPSKKGCLLKQLDPFNKQVLPYIWKIKRLVCSSTKPLILSNQTSIWIDKNSRMSRNLSDDLSCCYRPFWRRAENKKNAGKVLDYLIQYGPKCHKFRNSANIYDEYIEVICYVRNEVVYRDYHAFVVIAKRKVDLKRTYPAEKPSVLIIGLDSMSRANFYRQMPKTLKLVKKLGAFELRNYNKIGDNTFPNVLAILKGQTNAELQSSCWKDKQFFDGCKFIWDDFHNDGYVTAFAEDATYMGLFLYLRKGFRKQPTDIYTQPYMYLNEDSVPSGIGHYSDHLRACSGSRLTLDVLFDYCKKFVLNMTAEDLPYWGYFWGSSLTHDYINVPPNVDEIYKDVFQTFNDYGVLNNTLVIFMSDHGFRYSSFRQTYQGYLEERLPFSFIMVPQWIKDQFPLAIHKLKQNSYKLTTHFDIWTTMLDVLQNEGYGYGSEINERSSSLFDSISDERNCRTASIPEHYCTCHRMKEISVELVEVQLSAKAVVSRINKMLRSHKQCAYLYLKKVQSARELDQERRSKTIKMAVMMDTYPGKGMFEATVNYIKSSSTANVLGDISRTNAYGNSSYCIDDKLLKLYCYCK